MSSSEVDDDEQLLRRIHPSFMKGDRPSSAAFKDEEMSVNRELKTDVETTLQGHATYGVARFKARFARELEQRVEPKPELYNPGHAEVIGHKTQSIARKFAKGCELVRAPVAQNDTQPVDDSKDAPVTAEGG